MADINFRGRAKGLSRSTRRRRELAEQRGYLQFNPDDVQFQGWQLRRDNQQERRINDDPNIQNADDVEYDPAQLEDNVLNREDGEDEVHHHHPNESADDSDPEGDRNTSEESEIEYNEETRSEGTFSSIGDDDQRDDRDEREQDVERENDPFMQNTLVRFQRPINIRRDITIKDYFLAGIAMSMRHHFTYEATLSYYQWINSTAPDSGLPNSKKSLWKALQRNDKSMTRHLYCRECRDKIGTETTITKECSCKKCGPDKRNEHIGYFLSLNLRDQLKELFSIPNIANALQYRFNRPYSNRIRDIYDGAEYKRLCEPNEFLHNQWNFSYIFNTDGANISDSSSLSAWPIFIEINELPPHLRKKHMLLASIWVDKQKPLPNTYLLPFVDEAKALYNEGVNWNPSENREVVSKFIPVIFCADSGARYEYIRMTQFTGKYGCTFCYHPGERVPNEKPYKYPADETYPLRTDASIREDATQAYNRNFQMNDRVKSIRGVKGPTALGLLPYFDLGKGPIVDTMHNIAGVIKQHFLMLLEDFGKEWYIGSPMKRRGIEDIMKLIKFPSRISRSTRGLKEVSSYKCSEWRNFAYYGLICLEGILPDKYFKHLALLFEAVYILNSDSILPNDIDRAERLLMRYVKLFGQYFGTSKMTYNIHLLTHVAESVRNWGPMWVHNAYVFESMNRKIIQTITSPNGVVLQVYTRFLMNKFIQNCAYDRTISRDTRKYISRLLNVIHYDYDVERDEGPRSRFICSGRGTRRMPTESEAIVLRQIGYTPEYLKSYNQARIDNIMYRARDYRPGTKFSNCTICYDNGQFGDISSIVSFTHGDEDIKGIFLHRLQFTRNACYTTFIKNVFISDEIAFVEEENIEGPALKIASEQGVRVIKLPNVWETD